MGGRGNMGTRNTDSWQAYTVGNNPPTAIRGGSRQSQIDEELKNRIKAAEKAGYEVIGSPIETPDRDQKVSKLSKLWKYAQEVKREYDDVIILQRKSSVRDVRPMRRGGFNQTGFSGSYVVMARREKK